MATSNGEQEHMQPLRGAQQAMDSINRAMADADGSPEGVTVTVASSDAMQELRRQVAEEANRGEPGRVKLTVNLPEQEMETLRKLAKRRDISMTDAVRRAIAMEQFIEEVERDGGKLLVEQSDHSLRQLLLR